MKKARATMALVIALLWLWVRTHGLGPAAPYGPDYCILIVWLLLVIGTRETKPKAPPRRVHVHYHARPPYHPAEKHSGGVWRWFAEKDDRGGAGGP